MSTKNFDREAFKKRLKAMSSGKSGTEASGASSASGDSGGEFDREAFKKRLKAISSEKSGTEASGASSASGDSDGEFDREAFKERLKAISSGKAGTEASGASSASGDSGGEFDREAFKERLKAISSEKNESGAEVKQPSKITVDKMTKDRMTDAERWAREAFDPEYMSEDKLKRAYEAITLDPLEVTYEDPMSNIEGYRYDVYGNIVPIKVMSDEEFEKIQNRIATKKQMRASLMNAYQDKVKARAEASGGEKDGIYDGITPSEYFFASPEKKELLDAENEIFGGTKYNKTVIEPFEEKLTSEEREFLINATKMLKEDSTDKKSLDEYGKALELIKEKGLDLNKTVEYLDYLYNQKRAEEKKTEISKSSNSELVGKNVLSVPANLLSGLGMASITFQTLRNRYSGYYKPVDFNTPASDFANFARNVRSESENRIDNDVLKFAYSTTMSLLDSAAAMAVGAAIGAAGFNLWGASAQLANKLVSGTSALLLSGSAGFNGIIDAKERGASDIEAVNFGIACAINEALFEKFSIEKLINMKTPEKLIDCLINIAVQSGVEGSEEVFTSIANAAADAIIMGDKSQINLEISERMKNGEDRGTAERGAFLSFLWSLGLDFLGGAVSGSVFGAATSKIKSSKSKTNVSDASFLRDVLPALTPENADIKHPTLNIAQREALSAGNAAQKNGGKFKDGYISYLREKSGGDVTDAQYDILYRAFNGYDVERDEAREIAKNSYALELFNHLAGEENAVDFTDNIRAAGNNIREVLRDINIQKAAVSILTANERDMLGENGRKNFSYLIEKGDIDENSEREYSLYYRAGLVGNDYQSIDNIAGEAVNIPEYVRAAAYDAGLRDRYARGKLNLYDNSAGDDENSITGKTYGGILNPETESEEFDGISRQQIKEAIGEQNYSIADAIGRDMGVGIRFVPSDGESDMTEDIFYNPETAEIIIPMRKDIGNIVVKLTAHETTHRLKDADFYGYLDFRDYIVHYFEKNGVNINGIQMPLYDSVYGGTKVKGLYTYITESYRKQGIRLSADAVYDEIASKFIEHASDYGDIFEKYSGKNRSFAKKVIDFLRSAIKKIKNKFSKNGHGMQAETAVWGMKISEYEHACKLWEEAYRRGERNVKNAAKNESRKTAYGGKGRNANETDAADSSESKEQSDESEKKHALSSDEDYSLYAYERFLKNLAETEENLTETEDGDSEKTASDIFEIGNREIQSLNKELKISREYLSLLRATYHTALKDGPGKKIKRQGSSSTIVIPGKEFRRYAAILSRAVSDGIRRQFKTSDIIPTPELVKYKNAVCKYVISKMTGDANTDFLTVKDRLYTEAYNAQVEAQALHDPKASVTLEYLLRENNRLKKQNADITEKAYIYKEQIKNTDPEQVKKYAEREIRRERSELEQKVLRLMRKLTSLRMPPAVRKAAMEIIGEYSVKTATLSPARRANLEELNRGYKRIFEQDEKYSDAEIEEKVGELEKKHIRDLFPDELSLMYKRLELLALCGNEIKTREDLIRVYNEVKNKYDEYGCGTFDAPMDAEEGKQKTIIGEIGAAIYSLPENTKYENLDEYNRAVFRRAYKAIEHAVKRFGTLIDSEVDTPLDKLACQQINTIMNAPKDSDGIVKKIQEGFAKWFLTLGNKLRRIEGFENGTPLMILYSELQKGSDRAERYKIDAAKLFEIKDKDEKIRRYFDDWFMNGTKKRKGFFNRIIIIKGEWDGSVIEAELTPDILAYLYLSTKNSSNMDSISKGGVVLPDIRLYLKGSEDAFNGGYAQNHGKPIKFKKADIVKAYMGLDAEEKAFIDKMHYYFNVTEKNAKNEASRKRLGYDVATVENYVPKITSNMFIGDAFAVDFDNNGKIINSDGPSLKHRITGADAPIKGCGIIEVWNRSVESAARYAFISIPVANLKTVLESKVVSASPEFKDALSSLVKTKNMFASRYLRRAVFKGNMQYNSVKEAISKKFEEKTYQGIVDELNSLSETKTKEIFGEKLIKKIRSNYAKSVLSLNLSSTLVQLSGIESARSVLGGKATRYAYLHALRPGDNVIDPETGKEIPRRELIYKYTVLYEKRERGSDDIKNTVYGIKKSASQNPVSRIIDKLLESKALDWMTDVDIYTIARLWVGAEYKVSQEYAKKYGKKSSEFKSKFRSDKYYRDVAKIFDEAVKKTQPNTTPLERPLILKRGSALDFLTMFASQRYANLNMLYEAFMEFFATVRRNKVTAGFEDDGLKEIRSARRKLKDAIMAQLLQSLIAAIARTAVGAGVKKNKKYYDKYGDIDPLEVLKGFAGNTAEGIFEPVPIVSEVVGIIVDMFGKSGYTYASDFIADTAYGALNDAVNAVVNLIKGTDEAEDLKEWFGELILFLDSIGPVVGRPFRNIHVQLKGLGSYFTD